MATIKLGAFASSIAGSVGGTTFRRGSNNITVSNKSRGRRNNLCRSSASLVFMQSVFQEWSALTTSSKNQWKETAARIQFPNKFGDMVNLTARQVFVKAASTAKHFGSERANPNLYNSSVVAFSFEFLSTSLENGIRIRTNFEGETVKILMQAALLDNSFSQKALKRREVIVAQTFEDNTDYDITFDIINKFGLNIAGKYLQLWLTPVNESFYRGVPACQVREITV